MFLLWIIAAKHETLRTLILFTLQLIVNVPHNHTIARQGWICWPIRSEETTMAWCPTGQWRGGESSGSTCCTEPCRSSWLKASDSSDLQTLDSSDPCWSRVWTAALSKHLEREKTTLRLRKKSLVISSWLPEQGNHVESDVTCLMHSKLCNAETFSLFSQKKDHTKSNIPV